MSEFLTLYLASLYKDDLYIFLDSCPASWLGLEKYAVLIFQVRVPQPLAAYMKVLFSQR